ncbi:sigma-70 family RNA polymerase sigma factor [Nonomuraea sp. NPDC046570]|uniref:RNA polymerase sigma factor n=1 Tax=Nonomuraea sp. NPDC046570 TaxID=3155255 RepID=UPI00340054F1
MNDRDLVEALRARDPGALAALYDTHAEAVYRYCWSLLMSADSAQVALRDTLIAAEAHAGSLADPDRLRPWLLALARGECLRRRLSGPPQAGLALVEASPLDDPDDADLRVMAWNAVQALEPPEREILELATRHDLSTDDVAAVLGGTPRQIGADHDLSRERLGDAITAEILARKGPYDCPLRARILTGFSGELTLEMREQVIRHLSRCGTCEPHRARQVSAAKVFELLPTVALPETLKVRVMSCFVDPELEPYRLYVARRSAALDANGFPVLQEGRRWRPAVAGALAAVATAAAIVMIFNFFGREGGEGLSGVASEAFPAPGEPPGIRLPWEAAPRQSPVQVEPILDSTATYPIGANRSTAPITVIAPDTGPIRVADPLPTPTGGPGPRPTGGPVDPPTGPVDPPTPSDRGSHDPTPTETPTQTPTQSPTLTPTETPTQPPTRPPSQEPTPAPTHTPAEPPTQTPTHTAAPTPTREPTTTAPQESPTGG